MVEKEKNIDGSYKGFIYCKSVDEAENLKDKINELINSSLNIDHRIIVKEVALNLLIHILTTKL